MKVFLTGQPGIGKTTVLLRCMEALEKMGFRVGGMLSREVREGGQRIGFEVFDPLTKRKGWLAHVNQPTGPRIGRYRVNLQDLVEVGVRSIEDALEKADCTLIDEVGPMELSSDAFRGVVLKAVDTSEPLLGTIHSRLRDPIIEAIKSRRDIMVYEVTIQNRENLHETIIEAFANSLRGQTR